MKYQFRYIYVLWFKLKKSSTENSEITKLFELMIVFFIRVLLITRTHRIINMTEFFVKPHNTYACRNIFNTLKTSGHSSLEKYTSHFIWKGSKGLLKVLLCERWVGDWTELQHIDPHSYSRNSVSFPFSWAAQPGAWGPSLSGTWFSFQQLISNWSELPVAWVI